MKSNAPEKLYIAINELTEDGCTFVLDHRVDYPTCTEYTRTDAFIEKACEFLKSYRQDRYNGMGYIAGIVNDETIEDFRKYMEE